VLEARDDLPARLAVIPHARLRLPLVFELVVALPVALLVVHHPLVDAVVIQMDSESLGLAVLQPPDVIYSPITCSHAELLKLLCLQIEVPSQFRRLFPHAFLLHALDRRHMAHLHHVSPHRLPFRQLLQVYFEARLQ